MAGKLNNARADRIVHHLDEAQREIKEAPELDALHITSLGARAESLRERVDELREPDSRPERTTRVEPITVEGITYVVRRGAKGSTIDTPCACLGNPQRTHDTVRCPWLAQRNERIQERSD